MQRIVVKVSAVVAGQLLNALGDLPASDGNKRQRNASCCRTLLRAGGTVENSSFTRALALDSIMSATGLIGLESAAAALSRGALAMHLKARENFCWRWGHVLRLEGGWGGEGAGDGLLQAFA